MLKRLSAALAALLFATVFAAAANMSIDGKIGTGQTPPVLTSCGTTPAIVGSDTAGQVTMGTTATGCIITFAAAYPAVPYCTVTWQATPLASQSYTVTATAITTVQTSASNNILNYFCVAR